MSSASKHHKLKKNVHCPRQLVVQIMIVFQQDMKKKPTKEKPLTRNVKRLLLKIKRGGPTN